MPLIEVLFGLALVAWVLNDVFNTVILPRPSPSRYRPAGLLTRYSWRAWRRYADGSPTPERREQRLGVFAPAIVMLLLGVWIVLLIVAFGLLMHALAAQVRPPLPDVGSALYFAAISLLTIGYGDFVPVDGAARLVAVAAGGVGLGIVALTITYLFSLYGNFQRRELLVLTLDARAGAPPSGVVLLETCARYHAEDELRRVFTDWERWSAAVLESHLAFPILLFFRSTHDHESWVSAIGAVLDASTLVLTTVEGGPSGAAWVMHGIGVHLVEDVARFFRSDPPGTAGVERAEFDEARRRLAAAGYALTVDADGSWIEFERRRSAYASRLNALARYLAVPPAQWIGDRSDIRH